MSLSPDEIRSVLGSLQKSSWDQAVVRIGEVEISVARNGASLPGEAASRGSSAPRANVATAPEAPVVVAAAPPVAANTPAAGAAPASAPVDGHVISAPSVGVFWRSPEPGAAPFVEVGSRVAVGDTLGIVEVMKLMNNIASDVSGEVVAVYVENATAVEYGTPLVTIRVES